MVKIMTCQVKVTAYDSLNAVSFKIRVVWWTCILDSPMTSNTQYPEKRVTINIGMIPTQKMDPPMATNIQYLEKLATINI